MKGENMTNKILGAMTLLLGLFLVSCGTTGVSSTFKVEETPVAKFNPPPAGLETKRIAIIEFKDKTSNSPLKGNVGSIAIDELTTLLVNSERFQVIERERIDALLQEQGLAGKGIVDANTAAKIGKVLGADLIFTGAITNWEVKKTKDGTFIIIGGTKSQNLHIELALDGRIIDTTTGAILFADSGEVSRDEAVSSTAILNIAPSGYVNLDQSTCGKQLRMALNEMLRKMIPKVDKKFSSK
jgi:curli biogenesis system outer membrane secretion channel CsgG